MTPRVRHGGRLDEACARFGGKPGAWLDLSTGINPDPWQPQDEATDWRALPEPAALAGLETAAARHFGAHAAFCAALPGSEAGLRLLARLLGLPGLCQPLSYGTYREAFAIAAPLADVARLPRRPTVLVLGQPNNPDGYVWPRETLLACLDHQERHGGWLVADEAFADTIEGASLAHHVASGRRLVVLRSFGKFFGLAGLRLGFVLAPPALVAMVRTALGDWPVHAAAIALGTAAYRDHEWIAGTRTALPRRAAALDALLASHGLEPQGDCPLFRLVRTGSALRLFERLAGERILTRPFDAFPDLVRFGVPAQPTALDRLDHALTIWRQHG